MEEIWVPIKNSRYEVSNLGRFRSVKILSIKKTPLGYMVGAMRLGTRWVFPFIHRLVAVAFLPPPPKSGLFINHKNCNKSDNRPENLEWVTRKQNAEHAVLNNRYKRGDAHYKAVLKTKERKHMRALFNTGKYTRKDLEIIFNTSKATISRVLNELDY